MSFFFLYTQLYDFEEAHAWDWEHNEWASHRQVYEMTVKIVMIMIEDH